MLTALVLICSLTAAADPQDCTRSNANTVMRVPAEFGNPATCFMQAQAYLAGSSIGRDLDAALLAELGDGHPCGCGVGVKPEERAQLLQRAAQLLGHRQVHRSHGHHYRTALGGYASGDRRSV